jgi:C4-dicarboxylate transporter DctQ subunit
MRYPLFLRRINSILANIAGVLLVIISLLSVFEAIMRSVFSNPTPWSLDISCYLLLWAIFLGTSYAYQEKGHVAVDLLCDAVQKRFGKTPRRVMSILGYIFVLATILAVFYASLTLFLSALSYNKLTTASFQIPIAYLYIAIILGSVMTVVTAVFIILDLLNGDDNYL